MSNKLTNLATSRKLQPIMGGIETEKYYVGDTICVKLSDGTLLNPESGKRMLCLHYITDIVPSYDIHDLLARLPKVIEHEKYGRCFFTLSSFIDRDGEEHYQVFYKTPILTHKRIGAQFSRWKPLLQALSDLLIWLSENNYLGGRDEV
jgi:hypothetical protein